MLVGLGGNVRLAVRVGRMGLVGAGVSGGNEVTVGDENPFPDIGTIVFVGNGVAESVAVASGVLVVRVDPTTRLQAAREPSTIMKRMEIA